MGVKKLVNEYVGAGVTMGLGNAVLGEIPGSSGVISGLSKGTGMMGVGLSAGMAGSVLNQLGGLGKNKKSKKHKGGY